MARSHTLETEIKLPVQNAAAARYLLRRLGFSILKRRVFERNTIFDTPEGALRQRQSLLRLRRAGPIHTLTFKGPPIPGAYKSREEFESLLADGDAAAAILTGLGYAPVFRYDKYRTEFGKPRQAGVVMLDETPIGDFLELEGAPEWIDRTARALGYTPADYITASYGRLYLDHRKKNQAAPNDMIFSDRT